MRPVRAAMRRACVFVGVPVRYLELGCVCVSLRCIAHAHTHQRTREEPNRTRSSADLRRTRSTQTRGFFRLRRNPLDTSPRGSVARGGTRWVFFIRLLSCAIATLCSLSLGRRRNTRACRARAPCHAGCSRCMPYGRALHQRGGSPSVQGHAPTCQPRPPTSSRLARVRAFAIAPPRSFSVGRRRSIRACGARAPRRADCGRSMSYERLLHQREACLLWCKAVLRRASCGLPHSRLARVRTCERDTTLALSREEAQHARLRRSRAVPRWWWSLYAS